MALNCISDICGFGKFTKVEPVNKGWSEDEKYYIEAEDKSKLLLRVSKPCEYERKKYEFEMMRRIFALDIPMNEPLDFGFCRGGKNVYSLFTWCEGEDSAEVLPVLAEEKQYRLGLNAGEILRKIHSSPAPESRGDWAIYFNRKIDARVRNYHACGLTFEGADKLIEYVESNRQLLNSRPQCLQHGDYHVGNIVISPSNELSIIDFNRLDYGDPWEEFNRMVWSAKVSPHFATGLLKGYFSGERSEEFFKLMAFYIAANTIGSLPWAVPFGQKEIDTMLEQAKDVLCWYDNMQNSIPSWYIGDILI